MSDDNRSDIKQQMQLKQLKLNDTHKPLWIKFSREDFNSLIKDVVDNVDKGKYKTIVDDNKYDLQKAEKSLLEIIIKKVY